MLPLGDSRREAESPKRKELSQQDLMNNTRYTQYAAEMSLPPYPQNIS